MGSLTIASGAVTPLAFTFDLTGSTQYGSDFGVNTLSQNGYASGRLAGFNVSDDGILIGRYTNGQSRNLAQIVLADFRNLQGLKPLGDNLWEETADSGLAIVGTAKPERLKENIALLDDGPLDQEQFDSIRERWEEFAPRIWVGQV